MAKITHVRPVLLTAPYGPPTGNAEVLLHLPTGMRTTGLVEITLDNGVKGLGEGYLAVFAPEVFVAIVELVSPLLVGRAVEPVSTTVQALEAVTGYWSFQGAARHVVSAIEIALQDALAQLLGVPLWRALGGSDNRQLSAYASGGDSIDPMHMGREIDAVEALGISIFKIRARSHQSGKAIWCQRQAPAGMHIAVDMTQNLAVPSQSTDAIVDFLRALNEAGGRAPAFLEEVQGPLDVKVLPKLRREVRIPIAGGEIVTTPGELIERMEAGCYDIAQPDATVIGGASAVLDVFKAAQQTGTAIYVHCWGAGGGMLANYHAAIAGGGEMVEWPLPAYPLRAALFAEPIYVRDGKIILQDTPGLGARLTPEIEAAFPFRAEATYRCLVDTSQLPQANWAIKA